MYILLGLILLLLAGTVLNRILLKAERTRFGPPGKLIEIDGHDMHLTARGAGYPTVVMTCGNGTPCAYTDFSLIEARVAAVTRTCVYERPGYGWSRQTSIPRDTGQLVRDLRRLLEKAGETPPYLFVAHSMGAMEVLLYARQFPWEVAGIVLIDGTSPYKHIHHGKAAIPAAGIHAIRFLNAMGLLRLAAELRLIPLVNRRVRLMPEDMGAMDKAMIYRNLANEMIIREGDFLEATAREMDGRVKLDGILLLVMTADHSLKKLPGWKESQDSLLKLSDRSRQRILRNADHITMLQVHGKEIAAEIEKMIAEIRTSG